MGWLDNFFSKRAGASAPSTADRYVAGVSTTPGWFVIGGFVYAASTSGLTVLFQATIITTSAVTQVRCRLVAVASLTQVTGSLLTFAAPNNAAEVTQTTSDLTSALINGSTYQIQAECTGALSTSDYATVRWAGVYLA